MVQKAKNNISGIIHRTILNKNKSLSRSPLPRKKDDQNQTMDADLPMFQNMANTSNILTQNNDQRDNDIEINESQNALSNLQKHQNFFEFDKSGNEQTFFFKEFLDKDLEENMNQIKGQQEQFEKDLENIKRENRLPIEPSPNSTPLGQPITPNDLSNDNTENNQQPVMYDSPRFKTVE